MGLKRGTGSTGPGEVGGAAGACPFGDTGIGMCLVFIKFGLLGVKRKFKSIGELFTMKKKTTLNIVDNLVYFVINALTSLLWLGFTGQRETSQNKYLDAEYDTRKQASGEESPFAESIFNAAEQRHEAFNQERVEQTALLKTNNSSTQISMLGLVTSPT
ncbi:hypothetical protein WN48_04194 [Eufriesea mexicana]|uniref:Uncharacterized protein n=1 Tax=Eufriesea mexicana TaxID=516756 RepID=A0A310SA64_9HYME|nr:hypothetical protein WN48_04194 [Eufriesea mexicana]